MQTLTFVMPWQHKTRLRCFRSIMLSYLLPLNVTKDCSFYLIQRPVLYLNPKLFSVTPSITDGVHRNENLVEIIPVFSTFSNFFKKKKKL